MQIGIDTRYNGNFMTSLWQPIDDRVFQKCFWSKKFLTTHKVVILDNTLTTYWLGWVFCVCYCVVHYCHRRIQDFVRGGGEGPLGPPPRIRAWLFGGAIFFFWGGGQGPLGPPWIRAWLSYSIYGASVNLDVFQSDYSEKSQSPSEGNFYMHSLNVKSSQKEIKNTEGNQNVYLSFPLFFPCLSFSLTVSATNLSHALSSLFSIHTVC